MRHKASRPLVDLWRRIPRGTARLLGEATSHGRPVRALTVLLAVALLGIGSYVIGTAMTGRSSEQARAIDPAPPSGDGPSPTTGPHAGSGRTPGSDSAEPTASPTTGSTRRTPPAPARSSQPGEPASATPADTTPPQTSLAEEFPEVDGALFTLSADEPATFACSLDGAAYTACDSPLRYADLDAGWHTLDVRATDAAGNTDPSPAETTWHARGGGPSRD